MKNTVEKCYVAFLFVCLTEKQQQWERVFIFVVVAVDVATATTMRKKKMCAPEKSLYILTIITVHLVWKMTVEI